MTPFILSRLFTKNLITRPFVTKTSYLKCCFTSNSFLGTIQLNNINYRQQFSNTSCLLRNDLIDIKESSSDDDEQDESFNDFVNRTLRLPETGHQVFIIQPSIKWGPSKKINTTPQLQLNEAVTLIKTLSNWKVVDTKIINLTSFNKKTFFGKGNLEFISNKVRSNKNITAIFLSVNILQPVQHRILEELFRVPVYDRYSIVMLIFREHATTKEAKLQVAMAEIPYMWSRLRGVHEGATDRLGGGTSAIGGQGETFIEVQRRLLTTREHKLKEALNKLRTHRELLRKKRSKLELPVVAIVGYTNAGKTSLIKALTGETSLQPKDQLFATLDVTVHTGILPSKLEVLFVDTIGFISDIPTGLIESFIVTLEDAMIADLIVHVQDVSHPDAIAQTEHVMNTLKSLKLPEDLLNNIVNVGNKADLLDSLNTHEQFLVSATTGLGLKELKLEIEKSILKATGRFMIKIRVRNGGLELSWLYKEATVVNIEVDENNNQFVFVDVLITQTNLSKFKHIFIKSKLNS